MKHVTLLLGAVIAAGVFASGTEAGVVSVNTQESSFGGGKTTVTTYTEPDRMRVETKNDFADQVTIFRKDKQVLWIIDNKQKTLMELTKNDVQEMKKQMEESMKMMEEQMKNMPAEQREAMGQSMSAAQSIKYNKTESDVKINNWVCGKYEGYFGGTKTADVWAADSVGLGIKPEDFNVMQDMGKFFSEFSMAGGPAHNAGASGTDQSFSGIPIRMITYSGGKVVNKTDLVEIRKEELSPSLFEVPEGLTKSKMF